MIIACLQLHWFVQLQVFKEKTGSWLMAQCFQILRSEASQPCKIGGTFQINHTQSLLAYPIISLHTHLPNLPAQSVQAGYQAAQQEIL
jgi:hypothetical protein